MKEETYTLTIDEVVVGLKQVLEVINSSEVDYKTMLEDDWYYLAYTFLMLQGDL